MSLALQLRYLTRPLHESELTEDEWQRTHQRELELERANLLDDEDIVAIVGDIEEADAWKHDLVKMVDDPTSRSGKRFAGRHFTSGGIPISEAPVDLAERTVRNDVDDWEHYEWDLGGDG
jgi:hypothetical protein